MLLLIACIIAHSKEPSYCQTHILRVRPIFKNALLASIHFLQCVEFLGFILIENFKGHNFGQSVIQLLTGVEDSCSNSGNKVIETKLMILSVYGILKHQVQLHKTIPYSDL